ncbi:MAG TPA: Fic family protein [Candidatus Nanoarchaeia archaeon]|nr:Fic family protein [Candidatus Nanoarchaeia archaeon]
MVSIEKLKKDSKTYFYISKNFRIGVNKWKKIRIYFGGKEPTKEDIKKLAEEIETRAIKEGLVKEKTTYKYLKDEEAEVLEDIKSEFNKFMKNLPETAREKYVEDFLIRFTYNSNAIEGNRLSLRDTHLILQENIIPQGATTYEYNEVLNSKNCMKFIKEYKGEFNKTFVLKVHESLTKNTKITVVGKYRDHDVIITGSPHRPPKHSEVSGLMEKLFIWYNNNKNRLHPIELACLVHSEFTRIHPFADGNGRTARIISNFLLKKNGHSMFFIDVKDRRKYYEALDKSDAGDERGFVKFIFDIIINQLKSVSR